MADYEWQHLEWMVHGCCERLICNYVLVQCVRKAQAQITLFVGSNAGHTINKETNTKIIGVIN